MLSAVRILSVAGFLIINSFHISGQGVYLGVKGGLSFPMLPAYSNYNNAISDKFETRTAANFGIVAEIKLYKWISLQPEVLYSELGGRRDRMQAFPNEMPEMYQERILYANFKASVYINTISVPIQLKISIPTVKNVEVSFNAGMFASYVTSAKFVSSGISQLYQDENGKYKISSRPVSFDTSFDLKEFINPFNYGCTGSIGISYQLKRSRFFIEWGGNFGFIGLQQDPCRYGYNYTGDVTIQAGYVYKIQKKSKKH
jgi:hypothetical protein